MKQLFKLLPVILMVAAISVAGCGDKEKESGDKGGDAASDKKDDSASNTPAINSPAANTPAVNTSSDATFVATNVSLPNMDWTWGACRGKVSSALTAVPEIKKVNIDADAKLLTFEAKEGFDVDAKLTELSSTVSFFEDFKVNK